MGKYCSEIVSEEKSKTAHKYDKCWTSFLILAEPDLTVVG